MQTRANLWDPFLGDGRPLILLTGFLLILSGLFAFFQSATGQFLPHDAAYLGMTARDLCRLHECRIVHFMIHDRISFGGSLVAVGTLYLWLAAFPLRAGEAWAWWVLAVSALVGFGSFLLYLGPGYLDLWHGTATLGLLPCYLAGMIRSRRILRPRGRSVPLKQLLAWRTRSDFGRVLLLIAAAGLLGAGMVIMSLGATRVFVPQDLEFMGVSVAELNAINPRLIPLIAHDRAGFGGGICCGGLTLLGCLIFGTPSRAFWQALAIAGFAGFSTAIFVHPAIGYTSVVHLLPVSVGAVIYLAGLALTYRDWHSGTAVNC